MIFSIYLVSQVTLISSGTDVVCGYHLLRCSYNILFSCNCIMNYSLSYAIYYKIVELDCCHIIILNIHEPSYKRLDTCIMSISRFSFREKVTLRLLKLHFYGADVVGWSRALDIRLRDWCCNLTMVSAQIPSKKEQNLTAQESNSNTVWLNFETYI